MSFYFFIFLCHLTGISSGFQDQQAFTAGTEKKSIPFSSQDSILGYNVVCGKLSDSLSETSGLMYYLDMFWTINDSGNPPCLYAFDSLNGRILQKIYVSNALNNDWEELCQDSLFIYIGDFGNNRGIRTDLHILKLKKSEIRKNLTDSVKAEKIFFSYADQNIENTSPGRNDFDMEAFVSIGDSLHLFSKNWINKKSRHYVCSKLPGTYRLFPVETLETDGLVSSACIDENGLLLLGGYKGGAVSSFLYVAEADKSKRFANGRKRKFYFGDRIYPGQNEGLCFRKNTLYGSSESFTSNASFFRIIF